MSLIERTIKLSFQQKVYFTRGVFDLSNPLLQEVLRDGNAAQTPKALVLLDESLHNGQPALARKIEDYFKRYADSATLVCKPIVWKTRR